jgi:hypothetical protein
MTATHFAPYLGLWNSEQNICVPQQAGQGYPLLPLAVFEDDAAVTEAAWAENWEYDH